MDDSSLFNGIPVRTVPGPGNLDMFRNVQLVYEKDNSVLQERYGKRRETLLHIAAALPNR